MFEERQPKKLLKWIPPERLKRGRPNIIWNQEINAAMREKRMEEGQWINRENWRESIKINLFQTRYWDVYTLSNRL